MKESSLARRYAIKLIANIAVLPVYLIMEALLPRALGPASYGNFNFITAQFQQATNFLDMGSSTCLCTNLSKRPNEFGLPTFYLRVAILVFFLTMGAGLLCLYQPIGELILPDTPLWLAPLGAFWAYLTWTGRILRGMNDALGITVPSELVRMSLSILGACTLLVLYFTGILNLGVLFIQQYFFLFLPALGYALVMRRAWATDASSGASSNENPEKQQNNESQQNKENSENPQVTNSLLILSKEQRQAYIKEFTAYSSPLFVLALGSALALGGERWLLQIFAGSESQGYFSLGQKVGMACFLFVSAMTPLFMRELAKAHGQRDYAAMGRLMDRYAPMLYAIAALLSAFSCIEGNFLAVLFGGEQFALAGPAVQIMALYPLHQAYGQLAGSVFHASADTGTLRNVSLIFMFLGLAVTYFMLAPSSSSSVLYPAGLNLGAFGLALKSVGVQVLSVGTLLWICSRKIHFNLKRNIIHQIVCLGSFLTVAFIAKESSPFLLNMFTDSGNIYWRFVCSALIYGCINLPLILFFPYLMGLTKQDLSFIFNKMMSMLFASRSK